MNAIRRRPTPAWQALITALAVLGLALSSACAGTPPPPTFPPPTATPLPPTPTPVPGLADIAESVAADVGQVTTVVEGDPERVIFVFEELHVSRLGRVEIALMLNRLYENYNLRHIGLEGHPASEPPLDLAWAHRDPPFQAGDSITSHEDVSVKTLEHGEINSAELMGLIYSDAVIDGIDDADLYAYEPPAAAWNAPYNYLFQIAFAGMADAERSDWQTLYDQGKYTLAYKFALATNDFTAEKYAAFSDPVNILSAEGWLDALAELKARAGQLGAAITPEDEASLDAMSVFFERSEQRSDAMAANVLALAEAEPGAPLAMTVGAGHTARLVELFTHAGVSFAVLRSQSMAEGSQAGLLSPEAYERKKQGRSVAPDGSLGSFLDGRWDPPPVADQDWFKELLDLLWSAQQLAESAAALANEGLSDEQIKDELNSASDLDVVAVDTTLGAPMVSFTLACVFPAMSRGEVRAVSFDSRPSRAGHAARVASSGRLGLADDGCVPLWGDVQQILDSGFTDADLEWLLGQVEAYLENDPYATVPQTGDGTETVEEPQQISSDTLLWVTQRGQPLQRGELNVYNNGGNVQVYSADGKLLGSFAAGGSALPLITALQEAGYTRAEIVAAVNSAANAGVKPGDMTVTASGMLTWEAGGVTASWLPDGTQTLTTVTLEGPVSETTYSDGTRVFAYPNGDTREVKPDGTQSVYDSTTGVTTTTTPDGTVSTVSYLGQTKIEKVTDPDGTVTTTVTIGGYTSTEVAHRNGAVTKTWTTADGTTGRTYTDTEGSSTTWVTQTDGSSTVTMRSADGNTTTEKATASDGSVTETTTTRNPADGSATTVQTRPDNSRTETSYGPWSAATVDFRNVNQRTIETTITTAEGTTSVKVEVTETQTTGATGNVFPITDVETTTTFPDGSTTVENTRLTGWGHFKNP